MCARCEELWKEGEPTCLPAAALDALEWLEWLHDYSGRARVFSRYDSRGRLLSAIGALRKELQQQVPDVLLERDGS